MSEFEYKETESGGLYFRLRVPDGKGPHPVTLMLHGWTGDENAMWIFANRMPGHMMLLAPRGMYASHLGGYSWVASNENEWSWVDDFYPAIEVLTEALQAKNFPEADFSTLSLVGFSQGAALVYALALVKPILVKKVAGMAGFMPQGAEALARNRPLDGKKAFVTHGSKDEIVPVVKAHYAVEILEQAGAQITYCEDDVGHKLSANCFRGLEKFFGS